MCCNNVLAFSTILFTTFFVLTTASTIPMRQTPAQITKRDYVEPHSLGGSYLFEARDGWQSMNLTAWNTKSPSGIEKRTSHSKHAPHRHYEQARPNPLGPNYGNSKVSRTLGGSVSHLATGTWNKMKGIGKAVAVTITWYTGNDLQNPSCWSQSDWAPTDQSFACALTLDGWTTRPQCFKFIEICNGSKKCVFVRVVDTCAGCAAGSKHVDLTMAPFAAIADVDQGILNVKMRPATEPLVWFEDLWGPKV